jgi:hypothetical protein
LLGFDTKGMREERREGKEGTEFYMKRKEIFTVFLKRI